VVRVISLQVELELPQLPQTHQEQVVAVVDISPQAVTHLVMTVALAEMVAVAVAVLTTQAHLVLAVTA
jgi:Asp-tRNA(Asn)/Glu-tRNA(Gln) amidotransferase B subunit